MNLQQLRYVVATADEGSMTAAARSVHVAQPALSRAVRSLEHELGVELFANRGRSVQLTPAGAQVVDAARRVLHDIDDLRLVAAQLRDEGTLTISSTPSLEHAYTNPTIARYVGMRPKTAIAMQRAGGREEVLALVRGGGAELGVADFDTLPDDLVAWPLDHDEVVLISPPGTELPAFVTLAHLNRLPLVLPSHASSRRRELDELFARHGITPKVAIESDERATWVQSMQLGIGSFLGFRGKALGLAAQGAVIRPFRPSLSRTIALVHRDGQCSDAARAFVDLACATVRTTRRASA